MRFLTLFCLAASAVTAQSLTTTFVGGNGQNGNMFDIVGVNPVIITGFDVHLVGTATIEVYAVTAGTSYVGNQANPAAWTLLGSAANVTTAGAGVPTPVPITLNVPINPAQVQGFYVTVTSGTLTYTNGTAVGSVFASNADIQFLEGIGNAYPFGGTFSPRVWNGVIHYTPAGGGTAATVSSYGSGCGQQFASFYENFTTSASFDLANTCIQMVNTGNGLVVTPGGAFNPVGAIGTPTTLALTDDSSVVAGTLGITVHSNGFVSLAPGNGNGFTPDVNTMLSNPATAFYSWHDMNPAAAGSGTVKYEESGVLAQITFDGVYDFGGTSAASANFIQFQINTATGGAVICWGQMSGAGNGHLVGFSPGGPSLNPGNSDLSTLGTTPIVTAGADQGALTLTAIGRPVEGAAAVNFNVTTSNIPASALLHLGIIGLSNPAVPLSLIGAPGCTLYADLIVVLGPVVGPGPLTETWTGLTLPAAPPSNVGFQFRLQSAILGTQLNQALGLGVLTSNGLLCTVGNL